MRSSERLWHALVLSVAAVAVCVGAVVWARSCAARPVWTSVRVATSEAQTRHCAELESYLVETIQGSDETERAAGLRAVDEARRRAYRQGGNAVRMPEGTRWGSRVYLYQCP